MARWLKLSIGRLKRIFRERREYVGQQQLLVLLLMLDAELDQSKRFARKGRQRMLQRFVDRSAPIADFVEAGSAEHAAPRTGVPFAFALIIAVEEIGPALVVEAIAGT